MTKARQPADRPPRPASRRQLATAVALGVVTVGLGMLAWRTLPARPIAQPAPAAAPTVRPADAWATAEFDLVTPPSADPVRIEIPARKRLRLMLAHRAASASYGWTLHSPLYFLKELPIPELPQVQGFGTSPPCPAIDSAWRSYLNTFDEETVPVRLAEVSSALATAPDDAPCRSARENLKARLPNVTHAELATGFGLAPGGSARVILVKRDPATGVPLKTWTLLFEATGPEPGWAFANEEAWLVAETARDIAAFALASHGTPPPQLKIRVTGAPGRKEVTIEAAGRAVAEAVPVDLSGSLWAPSAYLALAKALVAKRPEGEKVEPADGADTGKLLEALLDVETRTLLRENQAVSSRLTRAPLDPSVQEQAALLVASFALGEAAGPYSDVRRQLCALSAHLALAEAASEGAPQTSARVIATAALDALAKREMPALERLKRLPSVPSAERAAIEAWARALRLRATRDWRLLPKPAGARSLERREHMRALVTSLGEPEGAARVLGEEGPPPDWSLRLLAGDQPSVETGSLLRSALPAAEVAEIATSLGLPPTVNAGLEAASRAIAEAPRDRFVAGQPLEVLPRAFWGARAERSLANAVRVVSMGFWDKGDSAGGREFRQQVTPLQRLRLLRVAIQQAQALVRGKKQIGAEENESCKVIARELQQHPEPVTAAIWDDALRFCPGQGMTGQVPVWSVWFSPTIPRGTAYEAERRLRVEDVQERSSGEEIEALKALVTFEPMVFTLSVKRRFAREPNGADFARDYARVAEYDRFALDTWALAEGDNEARRLPLQRRLCELVADDCLTLGEYMADRDRDDEAARAFTRALEHARDRVDVSNRIGWLAHYHLDRGDQQRALAVAHAAAEVGSGSGLDTLGQIQERLGALDAAEQAYKAIAESYQDSNALNSFYIRRERRDGGGRFSAQVDAARQALFPRGFAQVVLADLVADSLRAGHASRVTGLRVDKPLLGLHLQRMGLRLGDLIAAVNGVRVQSYHQYACVFSLSDEPRARIIIWRDNRYQELQGRLPRLGYKPVR